MHQTQKQASRTDAIALLLVDHRKLRALFADYQKRVNAGAPPPERAELALKICEVISLHTEIEAKLFYPAIRAAIVDTDLVNQADVEHTTTQRSIKKIEGTDSNDAHFDARVIVLCKYLSDHLDGAESTLFPLLRKAKLDLLELGERMATLQERLLEEGSPVG